MKLIVIIHLLVIVTLIEADHEHDDQFKTRSSTTSTKTTTTITEGKSDYDWKKLGIYKLVRVEVYDFYNNAINSTLVPRFSNEESYSSRENTNTNKPKQDPGASKTSNKEMKHLERIILVINLQDKTLIADLIINRFLLALNYTETIIDSEGSKVNEIDLFSSHCYYTGVVRGYENLTAAVSTCNGVVGSLFLDDDLYSLEPIPESEACLNCVHKLYRNSEQLEIFRKINFDTDAEPEPPYSRQRRAAIIEWPQGLDKQTRILETFIVNDYHQYVKYGGNAAAVPIVTQRAKDIVNGASVLYHSQDIYVVIVGQEVWTNMERIPLNLNDSRAFIADFCTYRKTSISAHHDHALLITSQGPFDAPSRVAGRGYLGAICGVFSCAFTADFNTVTRASVITAHELGHNFGLNHDGEPPCGACDQPGGCIMDAVVSDTITKWSTCSQDILKSSTTYNSFPCLQDIPQVIFDPSAPPICGNGLIETGEQCDCGDSPSSECNRACCDNSTCKLVTPAQCAHGRCCDVPTCTFKPRYTVCRASTGACDLSEYCSGNNHTCPYDVYKSNLLPCTQDTRPGNCYNGQCRDRVGQCRAIYGATSTTTIDSCYTSGNARNNSAIGNCGFSAPGVYNQYIPCATADLMCGKIFCQGGSIQLSPPYSTGLFNLSDGTQCKYIIFERDINQGNLGYVQDGSPCGTGMACEGQHCKNVTGLSDKCGNCSGHGICNSLNQCHCDLGYAPPLCNNPGEGGSSHSNPIAPLPTFSTKEGTTSTTSMTSTSRLTTTTSRTRILTTATSKPSILTTKTSKPSTLTTTTSKPSTLTTSTSKRSTLTTKTSKPSILTTATSNVISTKTTMKYTTSAKASSHTTLPEKITTIKSDQTSSTTTGTSRPTSTTKGTNTTTFSKTTGTSTSNTKSTTTTKPNVTSNTTKSTTATISSTTTGTTTTSSTSSSTTTVRTTTTAVCTQKINCGFGGDALVITLIALGGPIILGVLGCCCCQFCLRVGASNVPMAAPTYIPQPIYQPAVPGRKPALWPRPYGRPAFRQPAVRYVGPRYGRQPGFTPI